MRYSISLLQMASQSPRQAEGPGYRAFRTHIDTLTTAITDPGHLATQLYAKGLIPRLTYQEATQDSLAPLKRSQKLLSALDCKIASEDGAFDCVSAALASLGLLPGR